MSQYKSASGFEYASYNTPLPISAGADAKGGGLKQVRMQLVTANTVYAAALPSGTRAFGLFPLFADVIFGVGEEPVALTAINSNAVSANFGVGHTAVAGDWTWRVLAEGDTNSLRLRSATANANVIVAALG